MHKKILLSKLREYCIKYDEHGKNDFPEHCYEGESVFNEILSYMKLDNIITEDEIIDFEIDSNKEYNYKRGYEWE